MGTHKTYKEASPGDTLTGAEQRLWESKMRHPDKTNVEHAEMLGLAISTVKTVWQIVRKKKGLVADKGGTRPVDLVTRDRNIGIQVNALQREAVEQRHISSDPREIGEINPDDLRDAAGTAALAIAKSFAEMTDADLARIAPEKRTKMLETSVKTYMLMENRPTEILSFQEAGEMDSVAANLVAELKRRKMDVVDVTPTFSEGSS